jgi:hypothetical protein
MDRGKPGLTDKEANKIMLGATFAQWDRPPSEEELSDILDKINYALLVAKYVAIALKGIVLFEMRDGELTAKKLSDLPPDVQVTFWREFDRIENEPEGEAEGNGEDPRDRG